MKKDVTISVEELEIRALAEEINSKITALIGRASIYDRIGDLVDARKAAGGVIDHVRWHFAERDGAAADDRPALQIEITPAMVEAGVRAASLYDSEDDLSEIVSAVFLAMLPLLESPPSYRL